MDVKCFNGETFCSDFDDQTVTIVLWLITQERLKEKKRDYQEERERECSLFFYFVAIVSLSLLLSFREDMQTIFSACKK